MKFKNSSKNKWNSNKYKLNSKKLKLHFFLPIPNANEIHLIETLKWLDFLKKTLSFPNLKDYTIGFYQTYFPNKLLVKKKKKKTF